MQDTQVSLDDFVLGMAAKLCGKFEVVSVIQAFAFASVKMWAVSSKIAPVEVQDDAMEKLFKDMREVMAQCQKELKNPDLN